MMQPVVEPVVSLFIQRAHLNDGLRESNMLNSHNRLYSGLYRVNTT